MAVVLRVYAAGMLVLIGAIVANVAAGAVGLKTWYDVLKPAAGSARAALSTLTLWDVAFLFLLYPGWLGACAYLVLRARAG